MQTFTLNATTSYQQIKNIITYSETGNSTLPEGGNPFLATAYVSLYADQNIEFSNDGTNDGLLLLASANHREVMSNFLNLYVKTASATTIRGGAEVYR